MLKKKNGQSTLEYAVLIVVMVAALMALKIYMGRGVQGKLRESVDQIGEQYSAGTTTYKISTEQTGKMITKETFGVNPDSPAPGTDTGYQGVSGYKVDTVAPTTHKTEKGQEEKIDTAVKDEKLFP